MAQNHSQPRRSRAYLSPFTLNQLHLRNPYVTTFWSLLTPGLGSLLLDRKVKGFILIIWAILVNTNAKINTAIVESMTGHFQLAKHTIDKRWLLLYIAVYVYAAWDTYRGTVEVNKWYILADREDAPVTPFVIDTWDINALDKRTPILAGMWSVLTPGLGNLYLHKSIEGIFFVVWSIVVMYLSHILPAIHFTMTGDYPDAKAVLNVQWLLYLPSIYVFQIYDCYVATVEGNKLFEKEQRKWLRNQYQQLRFKLPI